MQMTQGNADLLIVNDIRVTLRHLGPVNMDFYT